MNPTNPEDGVDAFYNPHEQWLPGHGPLTKREYFAAMAMQGFLGSSSWEKRRDISRAFEIVASDSCFLADALIVALNKNTEENNGET